MKIDKINIHPYEIPFVKDSRVPMASDNQFLYTDIGGQIQRHTIQMNKEMECYK